MDACTRIHAPTQRLKEADAAGFFVSSTPPRPPPFFPSAAAPDTGEGRADGRGSFTSSANASWSSSSSSSPSPCPPAFLASARHALLLLLLPRERDEWGVSRGCAVRDRRLLEVVIEVLASDEDEEAEAEADAVSEERRRTCFGCAYVRWVGCSYVPVVHF